MALLEVVIIATLGSALTNGAPSTELLRYQQSEVKVSSKALKLIENTIKNEIYTNLVKTHLGLTPDCAAVSCKQIAELKPHYDSGYYWIKGVLGAVGVYCDCLLYTSPSPRDATLSRMPSSA